MTTEQWLDKGICDFCRKALYCKTDCKAHKELTTRLINEALTNLGNRPTKVAKEKFEIVGGK